MNGPEKIPSPSSYASYLKPFSEVAKSAKSAHFAFHNVTVIKPENYKFWHNLWYTICSALDSFEFTKEFAKEGLENLRLHYEKKAIVDRFVSEITKESFHINDEQKK